MSKVEEIWLKLTENLPETKNNWWKKILENLNDSQRKYHNLESVEYKFNLYDSVKDKIKNKTAVEYAILFSYLEYDPRNGDSHLKNMELFKQFALDTELPIDCHEVNEVLSLIECTSSHLTEQHMTEGAIGHEDKHYFLDIDMSILGSPSEQYQSYAQKVREEYDFLEQSAYNSLRMKVLQSFLKIPNIFATEEFRNKYEKQARNNIEKEISQLN